MLEKDIERDLVRRVKAMGGVAYKFSSPNRRNVPDRLVMLATGDLFFVEVKAPGKKPTEGQRREHRRLEALGQTVYVVDSITEVSLLLDVVS